MSCVFIVQASRRVVAGGVNVSGGRDHAASECERVDEGCYRVGSPLTRRCPALMVLR